MQEIIDQLLTLSHDLGKEERKLSILGEGNTSAKVDHDSFLVKASGSQLNSLRADQLTHVKFSPVLDLIDQSNPSAQEVEQVFTDCLVTPGSPRPSVETFLHALCLTTGKANWVGHTHTESLLKILCSKLGAEPFKQHVYPDVIVVCGPSIAVVPYIDPGFELAVAFKKALVEHETEHGHMPKLVLMENHGPVALGQNATEVFNIMQMADKWANVLWGTYALGGPKYLSNEITQHIDNRPDEEHRRKQLLS